MCVRYMDNLQTKSSQTISFLYFKRIIGLIFQRINFITCAPVFAIAVLFCNESSVSIDIIYLPFGLDVFVYFVMTGIEDGIAIGCKAFLV